MSGRYSTLFFLIFVCVGFSAAQKNPAITDQLKFAGYLIKNNLTDDLFTLIHSRGDNSASSQLQKDSLNLLAGHAFYQTNDKDSAVIFFDKINKNSAVYSEACFYSAYILAETENYNESFKQLKVYDPRSPSEIELKRLHLASVALLMRDTATFTAISKSFSGPGQEYNIEENKLIIIKREIEAVSPKSGILAGMMSAIVPGLGKIYAGRVRQGITSFIPVSILGLQLFEAYDKAGVNSVRFYASAAVFSVFYIGNIWGSILSVSVKRNEINDEINNQILFNLRLPVQRLFR